MQAFLLRWEPHTNLDSELYESKEFRKTCLEFFKQRKKPGFEKIRITFDRSYKIQAESEIIERAVIRRAAVIFIEWKHGSTENVSIQLERKTGLFFKRWYSMKMKCGGWLSIHRKID
ncbi:hypothetical protein LEP1GSC058_1617 [Leptospira fainei serovar Hurstbridge str. BUT 6]|uniref:Uncharacterized protein n=1 Tax=Leptospira fainei serovar Hurstbridge str. BUT 6 TaxID=1193011 RepID=S3V0A2_9LEPT|nr:hypothetical protein LEP1GSC058_1617 [Leptospira fainei serovar Hurstbridge str. BUT 6]